MTFSTARRHDRRPLPEPYWGEVRDVERHLLSAGWCDAQALLGAAWADSQGTAIPEGDSVRAGGRGRGVKTTAEREMR